MAGGTGGHIFPGLAVASALRDQGERVIWIGSRYGLEAKLVAEQGLPIRFLAVRGLRNKRGFDRLTGSVRLIISIFQALSLIVYHKPKVCVGFGGYPAGPGGLAAGLTRTPLVIHEQNAVAGFTNRYLSKWASRVLTAFPDVLPSGECVGNPVRLEIDQVGQKRINKCLEQSGSTRIFIMGGSQGSRSLNKNLPPKLQILAKKFGIEITHQTGDGAKADVKQVYDALNLDATVVAFVSRMETAYQNNDIMVCRAGALTVSELASAAMPSVLIPFPQATDDHQTKNGRYLSKSGAAVIVQEDELDIFVAKLSDILRSPENLTQMARAARSVAKPEATRDVLKAILEVAHG